MGKCDPIGQSSKLPILRFGDELRGQGKILSLYATQQLADIHQAEVWKVSQIMVYRQYWMATLKDRRSCEVCGDLAVNAEYFESENGDTCNIKWVCDSHLCRCN